MSHNSSYFRSHSTLHMAVAELLQQKATLGPKHRNLRLWVMSDLSEPVLTAASDSYFWPIRMVPNSCFCCTSPSAPRL